MMTKEGSTKIVNLMTLVLGRGNISHLVKMHYFFKNLLLYTQAHIRQTESIEMMKKKESTKVVNFMTPGVGILVLGHDHISEMQYFFFFLFTFRHGSDKLKLYRNYDQGKVHQIC